MSDKREDAKKRAILLKQLREAHKETVAHAQEKLKAQQAVRRDICKLMRDQPKTVPEVAEASGIPAHEVLWHITAMKKYGLVVETGMCGEYYLYQRVKDGKK
ncbi:MAG: helix-turn-helix transcriptional regulator [Chloroflexi bacterium]|nr:helix-turn-helix transcriptional regulator [Chloroflexota bacterium]